MIKFFIQGSPVPKGRPKFTTFGKHVKAYTPKKTENFEAYVRLAASQHTPDKPIEGPIKVVLEFVFRKPKSIKKGVYWKDKKPDLDNLCKSVCDGMDGFWMGDQQICELKACKRYGDKAGVYVAVEKLEHTVWKERIP